MISRLGFKAHYMVDLNKLPDHEVSGRKKDYATTLVKAFSNELGKDREMSLCFGDKKTALPLFIGGSKEKLGFVIGDSESDISKQIIPSVDVKNKLHLLVNGNPDATFMTAVALTSNALYEEDEEKKTVASGSILQDNFGFKHYQLIEDMKD